MGELLPTEPLVDPAGINNNNPSRMVPYASEQTAPTGFLCINVGGKSYRIRHKTIQMRESRLGLLGQLSISNHQRRLVIADDFFADSGEYYFERTSKAFDPII
uniref:Potassium channel tetramerisation-type BTB domain-containing protein n=1 Tax=Plectus sambesii TaxID=2011161 RepID=A0A914VSV5_9BILA